ncbi:hypothetical protein CEE69_27280 [Rhodopirellula bahusiensis]|uniref:Uncharacterized protein n=1 Tax=Rhodopirellula bahusiensis TaxID=2014065 RepID=A0A2G1VZ92_9BACT|nr:hypothetical protein CEE69_27280 [Rhodopirellula bahusiensis]
MSKQGISVGPNAVHRLLREELDLGRRQALEDRPLGDCPNRDAQVKRIDKLRRHFTCWGHSA